MSDIAQKLTALFRDQSDVVHLAHHVQNTYFSEPTRPFHNPGRGNAIPVILSLTDELREAGIKTHATALCDRSEFLSPEEAGMHPDLCRKAATVHCGYMSSAFKDNSAGFNLRPQPQGGTYNTIVLTGYNTDMCFHDTVMDALAAGFNVVVPVDGTENATVSGDKRLSLAAMENAGAILCNASEIIETVKKIPGRALAL